MVPEKKYKRLNSEVKRRSRMKSSDTNCQKWQSFDKDVLFSEGQRYTIDEIDGNISVYFGVRRNLLKTVIFCFLIILTGGFVCFLVYWKPKWRVNLTQSECALENATSILLEDQYGQVCIVDVKCLKLNYDHELLNVLDGTDGETQTKPTSIENVHQETDPLLAYDKKPEVKLVKYFEYRHQRYIWNGTKSGFELVANIDRPYTLNDAYQLSTGLSKQQELDKMMVHGENTIDVLVKSYGRLFVEEAADPFYVFQMFSCIMWFFDDYYYYAGTIIIISVTSILLSVYQTRQHLVNLRNMIAKSAPVTVLRPDGSEEVISSKDLVPADVIVIPTSGCDLHCDAALLSGNAIVNESMLTGESIPVTKTPLPNPQKGKSEEDECIDMIKHKRHILFCGTKVLQTRFYNKGKVLAIVVRTGYYTVKGSLIRSILYPKPVGFKFFSDALKFVGVLCILAAIGFIYTCYVFLEQGASPGEIMLRALDVITIAVPPALPAAMSVGTIYALQRLKNVMIYCTSPSRINICGKIKLFCFDKTGTLTEDGLDVFGILFAESGIFQELLQDLSGFDFHEGLRCMATCHSLTYINGELTGDPLDVKMFEATGWQLEESPSLEETERFGCLVPTVVRSQAIGREKMDYESSLCNLEQLPIEIAILKLFTFSSELQRMSVVARTLGNSSMDVYAKGSPETIARLCIPNSLPENYEQILKYYAEEGFRIIAFASKSLPERIKWHNAQHLVRSDVEKELTFRGFLILKNMVKKETRPTVERLIHSAIRVVMITGDNMLTAISVARESHIVQPNERLIQVSVGSTESTGNKPLISYSLMGGKDGSTDCISNKKDDSSILDFRNRGYHFAMTGKTWITIRSNLPNLYQRLLVCGTVFARMLPDQKAQLVEDLQSIGYTVGMCGDGANDCGALKVAHAGVSLSEAEASVASPFTSQIPNISCVIEIVKEGRCALVTSFSLFKYMAMYSMVQYISVLILYSVRSNLGDLQYLYIDLLIIMPFAITMSRTGPYHTIVPRRPLGSLIHPLVLSSLFLQIFLQTAFQLCVFFFVKTREYYRSSDWFFAHTPHKNGKTQIESYDNTVLFYLTSFQYIFLAVVLSMSKPYRDAFYKNIALVCTLLILLGFTFILVLYPVGIIKSLFQLVPIQDDNFILALICWAGCNAALSYLIERYLIKSTCFRKLLNFLRKKKRPRNKYKQLTIDFSLDELWPPT